MSPAEKWLKFILRLNGALAVGAIVAVAMPHSWLFWCAAKVEPGHPQGFLVPYLARTLSMYFVLIGILMWIFAGDVYRFRVPITVVAVWALSAIALFGLYSYGYLSQVAKQWFFWFVVGDATYSVLFVAAILVLQSRLPPDRRGRASNPQP